MSYCRFSCENWKSDVYVYADCDGGWTTHVACKRILGDAPTAPPLDKVSPAEWLAAHQVQQKWLEQCAREQITLPYAGQSFCHATPEECVHLLETLRDMGYCVPQHAVDALCAEVKDWEDGKRVLDEVE